MNEWNEVCEGDCCSRKPSGKQKWLTRAGILALDGW